LVLIVVRALLCFFVFLFILFGFSLFPASYLLKTKHDDFRSQFMAYSAQLAQWVNEIRGKGESGQPISPEKVEELFAVIMTGFRYIFHKNALLCFPIATEHLF
jgi:hypothetical protein